MKIKILKTVNLKKSLISEICKLKNTEWQYGISSNLKWFNNNINNSDNHFLLFRSKILIGYVVLRERNFFIRKVKKNYFFFDTLIIKKKFRNKNYSSLILDSCNKFIKKKKKPALLFCFKKMEKFYSKFNWEKINKKNYKILDYKTSKTGMIFNLKTHNKLKFYFLTKKYFKI